MSALFAVMNESIFLWPVAVCAVFALFIALERLFFVFFRAQVAAEPFFATIQRHVLDGNLDAAIRHASMEPRAPLAIALRSALVSAHLTDEDVALSIDRAMLESIPSIQKRIGYLATLANVATLFGLLGTIVGLIRSFNAVSLSSLEDRQAMLAAGIATAMYTTAGGISVAIPTLLAYAVLVQRGNAILDDAEHYGMRLRILLRARGKQAAEAAEAPEPAAPANDTGEAGANA